MVGATILIGLLLALGTFFLDSASTDLKVGVSHAKSFQAYYLAEAGVAYLVREIQNDTSLTNGFISGSLTQAQTSRERNNVFSTGDGFTAYAISLVPGEATIFAAAKTSAGNALITRRTQTRIARAVGSAITDYAGFVGGNGEDMQLRLSVDFIGGIIYAQDDIDASNAAQITMRGGNVWAHDEIKVRGGATLTVTQGQTKTDIQNLPMPAVDFDSSNPTSWRSQATSRLTTSQFNNLPNNTVLNGIIFIEGSPSYLRKNITVNGLLVINGSFEIEKPSLLVINESPTGGPSGLLVKSSLEFENSADIKGIVYAGNYLEIEYDDNDTADPLVVHIKGGLIGRRFIFNRDISGGQSDVQITHDNELISRVLRQDFNLTSPLLDIGHWEENY